MKRQILCIVQIPMPTKASEFLYCALIHVLKICIRMQARRVFVRCSLGQPLRVENLDGRRSLPKAIAERALPDARAVCGIAFLSQEVADGPHEIELIPNETNE